MEEASPGKWAAILRVWRWLGVGLARLDSDGQILGWRIRQSTPDVVVLAPESVSGTTARIVLTATSRRVVQTMVVRYDRWFARPLRSTGGSSVASLRTRVSGVQTRTRQRSASNRTTSPHDSLEVAVDALSRHVSYRAPWS
jgi:hypothetical protein